MNKIILISVLVEFVIFQFYYSIKYKVQPSISASIFVLTGTYEKWFYQFMILITSFGLGIVAQTPGGTLAAILICIDSFATATRTDKIQSSLHVFGATAGIIAGMVMLLEVGVWYLVPFFALFYFCVMPVKIEFKKLTWLNKLSHKELQNYTTWIENAAFAVCILGLFISRT